MEDAIGQHYGYSSMPLLLRGYYKAIQLYSIQVVQTPRRVRPTTFVWHTSLPDSDSRHSQVD
jgi:hypothetical protein